MAGHVLGSLGQDTRTCVAPLSVCVAGHDGERAQRDGRQRGQAGRGQDLRRAPLLHLQDAQGPAAARGARGGVRPTSTIVVRRRLETIDAHGSNISYSISFTTTQPSSIFPQIQQVQVDSSWSQ